MVKDCTRLSLLLVAFITATSEATQAQDIDLGKSEFRASCATCHGPDGKGNGPFAEYLKVTPADLTVLSRNNGGAFPVNEVYDAIYGIKTIVTHGTRDMPIWGYRYALDSNQAFYPKPSGGGLASTFDPEAVVRTRVLAVIDYLKRIQEK